MFGSEVLDVVIGIVFTCLLLSFICSAIHEVLEMFLKNRSTYLRRGIEELLGGPPDAPLLRDLYSHPLISGLFRGKYSPDNLRNLPSYIPARSFALALLDVVAPAAGALGGPSAMAASAGGVVRASWGSSSPQVARLREQLQANPSFPPQVRQALLTFLDAAQDDLAKTRELVEHWFNTAMDGVSGAYKHRTQVSILTIGLLVSAGINADSINIVTSLSTDKALRQSLVSASQEYARAAATALGPAERTADQLEYNLHRIRQAGLPLGWAALPLSDDARGVPRGPGQWALKFAGILLTGFAISLGAPFWFDVLNRIAVVRSTVKPHEKSPEESGKE